MFKNIRRHLTYSNVVSTLCLFVLLGGAAYAASKLPKDSVKSKQIKASAVKNSELADNAVTSPKVANGSLLSEDFAPDQLLQGAKGDKGDTGLTGDTGPTEGVSSDYQTSSGTPVTAQQTFDPVTLTTTHAGHLFVSKPITNFDVTCTTGASAILWAALDGVRVPGVVYTVSLATKYNLNFTGVTTDVIPAGPHVLSLKMQCASGTVNSSGGSLEVAGTLVVLGG